MYNSNKLRKQVNLITNNTNDLLFIGGTHGDEKSGYFSLLLYDFNCYKKKFSSICKLNYYGLSKSIREDENQIDINRNYGKENNQYFNKSLLSKIKFVEMEVLNSKYVIDFQESKKGIRSVDNNSNGNTVITNNSFDLAEHIVKKVNLNLENDKKFMVYKDKPIINNSLREFCNKNNVKYCLIEVSKDIKIIDRLKICNDIIKACENY